MSENLGQNPSPCTVGHFVAIPCGEQTLSGILAVPPGANGVMIFAHGCGSGRLDPKNQAIAKQLHTAAMATLQLDLFSVAELAEPTKALDQACYKTRLRSAADWLRSRTETARLPIGLMFLEPNAVDAASVLTPDWVKGALGSEQKR